MKIMHLETDYLLQEFRKEQPDLFDEKGRAFRMLTHQEPMTRMLELINALEMEIKTQEPISSNRILGLSTEMGKLKDGQFVTYKEDDEVQVYGILDKETISAFYPSEDGGLISIKISELSF